MKITKRQLLRLIREEAEAFGGGDVAGDVFVDAEDEDINQNDDPGEVRDNRQLPESRKVRVTKSQLRRMLREQAGGGLPSVYDLAKKLGAAGPEAAIDFVRRLLDKANFSAEAPEEPAAELVEPAAAPAVTAEEEPIDPQKA